MHGIECGEKISVFKLSSTTFNLLEISEMYLSGKRMKHRNVKDGQRDNQRDVETSRAVACGHNPTDE